MGHYLLAIHHTDEAPMGEGATMDDIIADVSAFNQDLQEQEAWVYAGGLQPAANSVIVDGRNDSTAQEPGTVVPGELQLGGMWIIDAPDDAAAAAWALRASAACRFPVEVRAFHSE
ncbi:hypothetical protein EG850_00625 [Gulosibacter macacae]|uniref:YCII-related domain-containing protein n=1 Tax=Gulosibacter macacae TaxID=2488791 RepID=A0A3P3W0X9_9MICO|nr:YciI family protein [Gulosibacter macacae]RRJ88685.1 hypothetical protein EG850_00625 [Gulosibacter macacae]